MSALRLWEEKESCPHTFPPGMLNFSVTYGRDKVLSKSQVYKRDQRKRKRQVYCKEVQTIKSKRAPLRLFQEDEQIHSLSKRQSRFYTRHSSTVKQPQTPPNSPFAPKITPNPLLSSNKPPPLTPKARTSIETPHINIRTYLPTCLRKTPKSATIRSLTIYLYNPYTTAHSYPNPFLHSPLLLSRIFSQKPDSYTKSER